MAIWHAIFFSHITNYSRDASFRVDNMLTACNSTFKLDKIKNKLMSEFEVNDLGGPKFSRN